MHSLGKIHISKHNTFHNREYLECLLNSTFNIFGSRSVRTPNGKVQRSHLIFIIQKSTVEKHPQQV